MTRPRKDERCQEATTEIRVTRGAETGTQDEKERTIVCQRLLDHKGSHSFGSVRWES